MSRQRQQQRPQAPLRECVDGCGRKRRSWKQYICRHCVQQRLDNPPEVLIARRAERFASRQPYEAPEYDASADPFVGIVGYGASVGTIGGETLLIDPSDPEEVTERLTEQMALFA